MAQLTSRLVISLVDRVSGPARGIASSLKTLHAAGARSSFVAMGRESRAAGQHMTALATRSAAAGMGLYGLIQQTKQFNESNFGYGFAKIPEFLKDGKLDLKAWNAEMKAAATQARAVAKEYGMVSADVMKAKEQVEKLGLKGAEGDSIFRAALGLYNTEPDALATDQAAAYMNAMYQAYAKQRSALAKKLGKDEKDPQFIDMWVKGIAAKTARAGAQSALGPADTIEGLRQYAPQWAQLGIPPELAMSLLAHGSNYGFRAVELGTSFKSMANRIVKPTLAGQRWFNNLGIDRSKFMGVSAQDPTKATMTLNNMLGGALDKKTKERVRGMLHGALKDGRTASPEFQNELTQAVVKSLGRNSGLDTDMVQEAVSNAITSLDGEIDMAGLLKELIDKKASPAALMEIFEGRHFARNSPVFQFWDKMHALLQDLERENGSTLDAATEGRKQTYAGSTTQLYDAWQEFFLTLQDTGVIEGVKQGLITLGNAFRSFNPEVVKWGTAGAVVLTALGMLTPALRVLASVAKMAAWGLKGLAALLGIGGAAAAAGGFTGFGMGAGAAGGALAGAAGRRMISGMGASGQMISGMSAAGAAAAQGKSGFFAGSRLAGMGGKLVRGMPLLGAGVMAADAATTYAQTGNAIDGANKMLAGSPLWWLWRASQDGWKSSAMQFAGLPQNVANAAASPPQTIGLGTSQAAQTEAQQASTEIKSILSSVDLTAEGQRIMASLAAGMQAGIGAVRAAAQQAANEAARAASRSAFSDGAMR